MSVDEKIRVLIVDDIAETRENIRRLLQFDLSIDIVGSVSSGTEAIEFSQESRPDVVIMDINMPDMDGITATEEIRQKVPHTQVIILSVQSDPNYMRRAMLAGARDFLTKPTSMDELTSAIRRAGEMAHEERSKAQKTYPISNGSGSQVVTTQLNSQGKVIVVYSPKGGTGTTSIATNLAISLKNEKNKVLLVDGNIQYGDVAVFLNEQVKKSVADLSPFADELDPEIVANVVMKSSANHLDVLPAPLRIETAEKVVGEQFGRMLDFLKMMYSYIIVDTATYLSDVVLSAIDISDLIVLVTTQDIPAIKNVNTFLTLTDASGIKRDHIIFIMNKYDKKISISPERVGESLRQPVEAIIPLDEKFVSASINKGVPFIVDHKSHPVSKSIISMASICRDRFVKTKKSETPIPVKA